jgi:D-alanine-D-alanine ligase
VLVEQYIKGTELSVAVLGNFDSKEKLVLPIVEIVPSNEFFDFESKYTDGKSAELVPARIGRDLAERVGNYAIGIHDALMCTGYSRIDFLVKDNVIYALEINTLPGMTNNSLYPKMARAIGMTFTQLIDKLIDLGLAKYPNAVSRSIKCQKP